MFDLLSKDNPAFTIYPSPTFTDIVLRPVVISPPPKSVYEKMEEVWKDEKARTPHIANGTVIGVDYMIPKARHVELGIGQVEFKSFLTSKFDRVPGYKMYGLGSGALTKIRFKGNDYVLFGHRGKKTGFTGGKIETIPQGLTNLEDMKKRNPCKVNAIREYYEEATGLPKIEEIAYVGIVQNPWGNNISSSYLIDVECPNSFSSLKPCNNGALRLKTSNKDETKIRELINVSGIEDYISENHKDIDWNSRARLKEALEQRII